MNFRQTKTQAEWGIKEIEYFKGLDLTLQNHNIKNSRILIKPEFQFLNLQLKNIFQIRKMLLTYMMKKHIKTFKIRIIMDAYIKKAINKIKIDLSREINQLIINQVKK